ncbi:hypothetical protein [Neogemmobacter tilapiae]|uniref:hypothetical protein n=1 Tax=Neogemmobacter tilapiae TaxID=875041 RepID=UPI001674C1F9|nr:hypothetical protein [Gemmobacter tilapiae]
MAPAAQAGTPVDEEVICPVGKKKFTITGTMSCSGSGTTMSLRRITSCDFVTELPVCPDNGLPVYREFDAAEIKQLKAFLKTDAYQTLLLQSDYYRAFAIEQQLKGAGTSETYWLLQRGLWHDYDKMVVAPGFYDLFLQEATLEKDRISKDDKPYMVASVAYQFGLAGNNTIAKAWLKEAKSLSDGSDFIEKYIKAVSGCLGKMSKDRCHPEAEFTP